MRLALERLTQLYKTSPVFQDLIETAAGTALATAIQAKATDLTPEELAIAASATFGAGLIGRPIVGRAGQMIGSKIDKAYPQNAKDFGATMDQIMGGIPGVNKGYQMKMAPYRELGPVAGWANMVGRGYGDNIAQGTVALFAPGILTGGRKVEELETLSQSK